jgi:acyl-CoA thioester hydrolase
MRFLKGRIAVQDREAKTEFMEMPESPGRPAYRWEFTVPEAAIDENGHVNNVRYVQWMQDLAVHHWRSVGGETINDAHHATWVARSHHIEYRRPAFAGDTIEALTWVVNMRKVHSVRKYAFTRKEDGALLAKGETDWVFVDVASGRPRAIPESVPEILPISEDPV